MNSDTEQVGIISYAIEIDVEAIKSGAKTAEEAIKTSFSAAERSASSAASKVETSAERLNRALKSTEDNLRPIATAATAVSAVVVAGFGAAAAAAFNQVRQVENASFGLRAYEKDAASVNTVLGQLVEFARSDVGVLFQREELFQAASTLKGFGEATSQLNSRVQILAQGVAVGNTTFAELSQIIGRSAQQGKLTTEAFDQLAYRGIILDSSLRGAAVGADELYQALDDAIDDSILQGRAQTIDGLLTRLGSAWRDLGGTILGVDRQTSQFISGGLGDALSKGIGQLTSFIRTNGEAIRTTGALALGLGGVALAIYGVVRAAAPLLAALTLIARHPAVAILSVTLGLFAGAVINKAINNTLEFSESTEDMNAQLSDTTNFGGEAAESLNKLSKSLSDINRNYQESLAEIVKRHEESIKQITTDLQSENTKYNQSLNERNKKFAESQAKEEEEFSKKSRNLQNQIDFLSRYNNQSNAKQLSALQFTLARENAQYQAQTAKRQQEQATETEAARLEYDQRVAALQLRLDEEQAVLNKHAEDVASIRGVVLLDEIEKLKRSRDEQIRTAQEAGAGQAGAAGAAANAIRGTNEKLASDINSIFGNAGTNAGNSFGDGLKKAISDTFMDIFRGLADFTDKLAQPFRKAGGDFKKFIQDAAYNIASSSGIGFSSGGFTGRGGINEAAGIVHRGEYVIPQSLVNQSTGLPKAEAFDSIGGSQQSTTNNSSININVSGIIASSAQDQRRFAEVIGKRLNEVMQQKGYNPIIMGV